MNYSVQLCLTRPTGNGDGVHWEKDDGGSLVYVSDGSYLLLCIQVALKEGAYHVVDERRVCVRSG